MSGSSSSPNSFREERIELLLDNAGAILKKKEEIRTVFETTIDSDLKFNNFDEFFRSLTGCFYNYVDEEEVEEVAEGIINTVVAFDTKFADRLLEAGEEGEELFEFFTELEAKYRIPAKRTTKRVQSGPDWWSNIKTVPTYRSGRPIFQHEIIKDYEERVEVNSDPENTLVLAKHFLQQILDAKDDLGDDIFYYINESTVEEIEDIASELSEEVTDYSDEAPAEDSDQDTEEDK